MLIFAVLSACGEILCNIFSSSISALNPYMLQTYCCHFAGKHIRNRVKASGLQGFNLAMLAHPTLFSKGTSKGCPRHFVFCSQSCFSWWKLTYPIILPSLHACFALARGLSSQFHFKKKKEKRVQMS